MLKLTQCKIKIVSLLLTIMMVVNVLPLAAIAEIGDKGELGQVIETEQSQQETEESENIPNLTEVQSDSLITEMTDEIDTEENQGGETEETAPLVSTAPVNRSDLVVITGVNMLVDIGGKWVYIIKDNLLQPDIPSFSKGMRIKFEYSWDISSENLSQFQPGDFFEVSLPDTYFQFHDTLISYDLKDQNGAVIGNFTVKDNKIVSTLNELGTSKNEIRNGFLSGIGYTVLEGDEITLSTGGIMLPPITIDPGGSSGSEEIEDFGDLFKSGAKFEEKGDLEWRIFVNYDNFRKQFNNESVVAFNNVVLTDEIDTGMVVKDSELRIEASIYVANEEGRMTNLSLDWFSFKELFVPIPYVEGMSESQFELAVKTSPNPAYGIYANRKVMINFGNLPGSNIKYPAYVTANNGQWIKEKLQELVDENKISQKQADETQQKYATNPEIIGWVVTIPTQVVGGSDTYNNTATLTYNDSEIASSGTQIEFNDINGGAETNEPGSVVIKKTDEKLTPLEGVSFKLQKLNTETNQFLDYLPQDNLGGIERITGTDGTVTYKRLTYGEYQVVETKGLNGYGEPIYTPSERFSMTAQTTTGIEINVVNELLKGQVELTKTDAKTSEKLMGAIFELQDVNGAYLSGPYETGEDGLLAIDGLLPGHYQLVETQAPTGYDLDTTPVKFEIVKNQKVALKVSKTNQETPGSVILEKLDQKTAKKLMGAIFELQDVNGAYL
ncbi:SpaA isopeptide-forming pilin-related protein, partial [uncultured Vagococcus sp.]|uniref:SpaA isopeptide-forming pilin-related protein n=1 Tax=uncultured Vagococcus sp. TaxID=189676 RepID=UPI0028D406AF